MAHVIASLMFGIVAVGAFALIAFMLLQSRSAIAVALGIAGSQPVRRYRAPVRVKVRRTPSWPASRSGGVRRAA